MKAVIDSDLLIDYLQGNPKARREIDRYNLLLYSIISWMEVMIGAESQAARDAAKGLIASMQRMDLTESIARIAVSLRKQHKLKLPDAMILASADSEGCILVTRNAKDFQKGDPRVRFPYPA